MLEYGIIGNCKACALVDKKGKICWMCYPSFDSPSMFAKILDKYKGGSFEIIPDRKSQYSQKYIENTNILETTIENEQYSFKVIDFFPRYKKIAPKKRTRMFKINKLIRIIEPIRGKPRIKIKFNPKLNYATKDTQLIDKEEFIEFKDDKKTHCLLTNLPHEEIINPEIKEIKKRKYLVIGNEPEKYSVKRCLNLLNATKKYWQGWVNTLILPNEKKNAIVRSALLLKLLTYSETGAIIAAATTSIPEEVGSERTWDYRYCWIRDASFCVETFKKIGRDYEAKTLMEFIIQLALKNDFIQPLYGIRGESRIKEYFLEHLEGFKGSKPVRVGNAAYNQVQNDIYGEIINIMYLYFVYYKYERKMTKKYWRFLRYVVNQIKFNWERKDSGIWEFRGIFEHYVFSKLMCYIGIDRAIKIAQHYQKEEPINEWLEIKEEIRNEILRYGYNKEINAFTIHYNSKKLDASLLLMTHFEFLERTDPRLINTVKAIYKDLLHNNFAVKRYSMRDDFGESKSAFTICSFWLVDALHYIGEKEKAKDIYNRLLKKGNHLGLYSEDIDIKSKKLIGNFPQAYTHIALINSSLQLSEWSAKQIKTDWTQIKRRNLF
ncbi:MAG: glycoside hydrolase family 15 protein [Nanobdellota archaeon]